MTKNVNEFHFDVFEFKKMTPSEDLTTILFYLFERHNFFETLSIKQDTFIKFAKKIQAGYRDNPYHNSSHAADVLQVNNKYKI